jgi:hypothetical protein
MEPSDLEPTVTAAAQLDAGAHAMRNDIATLRTAAKLVDDSEIADAIQDATLDLQRRLERMIVAARIELGRGPAPVSIDAVELLRLGAARARREGLVDPVVQLQLDEDSVLAPGVWAERLVADILHGADPAWIMHLATACGATLRESDGSTCLSFVEQAR